MGISKSPLQEFDDDGEPEDEHPEPKVGEELFTYYEGVSLFPTIVENGHTRNYLGAQTQYATLGQSTNVGVGSTSALSGASVDLPPPPKPSI